MTHELKARVIMRRLDIAQGAGKGVVNTEHIVAAFRKYFDEMRSQKTAVTGDEYMIVIVVDLVFCHASALIGVLRNAVSRPSPNQLNKNSAILYSSLRAVSGAISISFYEGAKTLRIDLKPGGGFIFSKSYKYGKLTLRNLRPAT